MAGFGLPLLSAGEEPDASQNLLLELHL